VGNIATETILAALATRGVDAGIYPDALAPSLAMAEEIRAKYSHAAQAQ
jgi:pyruvate/oxaloacetate carboxyltransferase